MSKPGGLRPVTAKSTRSKSKLPSEKQTKLAILKMHGVPVKTAKAVVGLSPNNNRDLTTGTIEQQREKALKALDLTIYSQFKTLKTIRDDSNQCTSDRLQSVKIINSMVPGYVAPEQINVSNVGIFAEFTGLSGGDLCELANLLGVQSVPNSGPAIEVDAQVIDNE